MKRSRIFFLLFAISCVTPKTAVMGTKVVCPVTQELVTLSSDTPHLEYEGVTYYFCCNDCPDEFRKDPKKYVKK